jgi:hypothetical protein
MSSSWLPSSSGFSATAREARRDRVVGPAGCHQRDRDLVQPDLDRGRDAVPFHQQPRLELPLVACS